VTIPSTAWQGRSAELNVLARKQRSLWGDALERVIRNRLAVVGLVVIALALLAALLAPWISPYGPNDQDPSLSLMEPRFVNSQYVNPKYLLGSDALGRDILTRLIWSARISMVVGFVPVALIFVIGVTLGLVSGYHGGRLDSLLMRFTDVVYAFPDLLFLLIVMATLRDSPIGEVFGGLFLMFLAIALVAWVGLARLTRGQILSLKVKEFVEAARTIGAGSGRIMLRHLLPNALGPIIVSLSFAIPSAILIEATLSFIGIGVKPPTPSWGVMIHDGFVVFSTTPWPVLLPAFCISIVMLSFTFVGDGLRDALDPRMRI
jgi:oligopeptide transport system permease protein